ncbi:hypothetical protein CAPTEDRAFT_199651 [Capitella teleta]|uniref:Uncharacterized protein n=1 Tax=Capitella teleta TaxID=283909 RepID=R7UHC6_CAPTE|nr:hypothetical protein CAPTEDRAFT_199651 [Capitella teleta]|eukprot:ELU02677.1 hypothetical protein CAPTEDRAFT_199651 [Capitella teleta]
MSNSVDLSTIVDVAYVQSEVLNKWNRYLRKSYEGNVSSDACDPLEALVIFDSIFNEDKVGPGKVDLTEMGQIAHHEGKHRTKSDFTLIMAKAGFGDFQVCHYEGLGFYDDLMGKKL